jgi:predicted alpha/beta hydrolase family esterase
MAYHGNPVRLLVIPGLHGSGEAHWQTWLQAHFKRSLRVRQDDWNVPDLQRWSERIAQTLLGEPPGAWVAVAHSFGCLALAHHLALRRPRSGNAEASGISAALLVAPAEPSRFRLDDRLPQHTLGVPSTMLASDTDPWMSAGSAASWAQRWGSGFINLGDVGHINVDSGFGPLPAAKNLTEFLMRRVEQRRRLSRTHPDELSLAN